MLIDIRKLSYEHPGGTRALDCVSLQVQDGENLVLLGPNGSGKTTLLLHLNGTLRGSGSVRVTDLEINKANMPEIRRRVGIVFQNADEQLFMPTVLDDVMFGPLNLGRSAVEAEDRARRVLGEVGISGDLLRRPPYHLSAGEKRRVALAGVLAMEPRLLLLDEPTTSLDPTGQRALLDLLKELPQPKVIATHDIHFAAALSKRAAFLESGRFVADGELREIVQRFDWNPYA
ncbi:MAG: energy-coupling factor ABC transporter ATP-binding protein [Acidobacteriaceae bacterium]|nr:energy-coupling factor ABC transporter ATP-binding protein [Acidobacteriaceae bacterium]MBV9779644.1 energy-coupling factor ABC transporter ATP-binding protein [Acidobacteriaceae bacterium]